MINNDKNNKYRKRSNKIETLTLYLTEAPV